MWKSNVYKYQKHFLITQGLTCKLLPGLRIVFKPSRMNNSCPENVMNWCVDVHSPVSSECSFSIQLLHHPRLYFFFPFGSKGWPLSLPRSLIPKARSILAKICWLGRAFPCSYSVTTCGFSQILVARSFWDISLACLPEHKIIAVLYNSNNPSHLEQLVCQHSGRLSCVSAPRSPHLAWPC